MVICSVVSTICVTWKGTVTVMVAVWTPSELLAVKTAVPEALATAVQPLSADWVTGTTDSFELDHVTILSLASAGVNTRLKSTFPFTSTVCCGLAATILSRGTVTVTFKLAEACGLSTEETVNTASPPPLATTVQEPSDSDTEATASSDVFQTTDLSWASSGIIFTKPSSFAEAPFISGSDCVVNDRLSTCDHTVTVIVAVLSPGFVFTVRTALPGFNATAFQPALSGVTLTTSESLLVHSTATLSLESISYSRFIAPPG